MKDRLLHPLCHGERTDWDSALTTITDRFRETLETWGPEAIGVYISGQPLIEDCYLANKFVKGWLGTANIASDSLLCMDTSVDGYRRAFGSDTVLASYEDLEKADLVVLVGNNHARCPPVLFQRLAAAKAARPEMKIVLVDPRRSATAELADIHLAIKPDSDVVLFTGLLRALNMRGMVARDYVDQHVNGFDETLAAACSITLFDVSAATGISTDVLDNFYEHFSSTKRVVSVFSQEADQAESGADKVNSIINCHLATGRIGRPGAGLFSVTGQPYSCGGFEAGGLMNTLATHTELANPDHRVTTQRFWRSPKIAASADLNAVDLFQAVEQGKIKAIWVMASNPAESLLDADRVLATLQACPFVVVSAINRDTDTVALADVALPAQAWSEKDGTVTSSERCISRQRCRRQPPELLAETRPDWWAIAQIASRLTGDAAFTYSGPAAIFREFAALSGTDNQGSRDFDISACAQMSEAHYELMSPIQWPWRQGEQPAVSPFFAAGGFPAEDRRARMIPVHPLEAKRRPTAWPLSLNTGRVREHWHTMMQTGTSTRPSTHHGELFIEVNPAETSTKSNREADLVEMY